MSTFSFARSSRHNLVSLFSATLVVVLLPAICKAQSYTVTDLGKLDGYAATGIALDSGGQVVGAINYVSGFDYHTSRAFQWSGGTMQLLPTLGGDSNTVHDINDMGVVVGDSSGIGFVQHAFVYSNGAVQDLGTMGGYQSSAYAINSSGQIVGFADIATFGLLRHAFLYQNGKMQDLGGLGGPSTRSSIAMDINSSGQIVGSSWLGPIYSEYTHAFLYSNGSMQDLGTLGGTYSSAGAINDSGVIAGISTTASGLTDVYRYSGGTMVDLGSFGGTLVSANDINSIGDIVGNSSFTSSDPLSHAFIAHGNNLLDLNSLIDAASGWTLNRAQAINDLGQITGSGTINGESHAYLLTPVPEPNSICLLGLGCVGLLSLKELHRRSFRDV